MAKKKKQNQGGGQQFLSPEKYLQQKARGLEIGTCYVTRDIDKMKMGHVIVTRKHTGRRISMAGYLVDMADILKAKGMAGMRYLSNVMHFGINENLTNEQQQKQYANYILTHPEELLRRLPKNEIDLLLFIKANREQTRGVAFANQDAALMMNVACVANSYIDGTGINRVRVADDFLRVALPLAADIRMSDEARQRYDVEEVIEGVANLYGYVTLEDAKRQLMMINGGFRSEADRLIDKVMETSLVLDFMIRRIDETKTGLYAIADDNIAFESRYGWDDIATMCKAIADHKPAIDERRRFTEEEIRAAGSGEAPIIPNACQKEFWHLLTREIGLLDQDARQICHQLWYKANHEEEPGFDEESIEEFFENEALVFDDIDKATRQKAQGMLKDYVAHIPRWTLKGFAPCEI